MSTVPSFAADTSDFPLRVNARQESVPLCPLRAASGSGSIPCHDTARKTTSRTEDTTSRVIMDHSLWNRGSHHAPGMDSPTAKTASTADLTSTRIHRWVLSLPRTVVVRYDEQRAV